MSEEWGPWIDHDGKCCPVPNGTFVHVVYQDGFEVTDFVSANGRPEILNPWILVEGLPSIIRYRIRKPKGLTILEGLMENLPQEEHAQ